MSKENREAILSEVKKIICNDRNEQYGEPEDSFEKIADYWTTYLKHNCVAPDADFDLGARDVFIDAIGYMTCATDIEYPKSSNWEKTNADN